MFDPVPHIVVNGYVDCKYLAVGIGIVVLFGIVYEINHGIGSVVLGGIYLWAGVWCYPVVGTYLQMFGGGISLIGKGFHMFDVQKSFLVSNAMGESAFVSFTV